MSTERVNSLDVAKRAGVSQSAVSRVFTPGASVSKKMSERVLKAAAELGYRPNVLARSLITGRSRIIGLVVAYLENQFYPDALEKLSNALQRRGYHILVFMASNEREGIDQVLQELLDYQVDGIITASVAISNDLTTRCEAAGIPVVLFNRDQDGVNLSAVTSNNFAGAKKIADFLVRGGHKRIAHIAGWGGSSTGRDREEGFRAGLTEAGRKLFACIDGMYNREVAAAAARDMLKGRWKPDAIFVGNDHMAFGVMDTLRYDLGLRVPEDISVVGYDDVPLSSWPTYNLTTLRQPSNRMVEATVETLLGLIEGTTEEYRKVRIDGPLMVRGTARVPEGWTDEGL